MIPHFEFTTISELLEDNYNIDQKECLLDELTQYDGKSGENAYIVAEEILRYILEYLDKYSKNDRNKHGTKKSCKCQECLISNSLVGLENILLEYVKQIEKLQTQLLNYSGTTLGNGMATIGNEISKGIIAKSSSGGSAGPIGVVGGAIGGAGGGFGVETEKSGDSESKTEAKELGPGATGGATGGALGSSGL